MPSPVFTPLSGNCLGPKPSRHVDFSVSLTSPHSPLHPGYPCGSSVPPSMCISNPSTLTIPTATIISALDHCNSLFPGHPTFTVILPNLPSTQSHVIILNTNQVTSSPCCRPLAPIHRLEFSMVRTPSSSAASCTLHCIFYSQSCWHYCISSNTPIFYQPQGLCTHFPPIYIILQIGA